MKPSGRNNLEIHMRRVLISFPEEGAHAHPSDLPKVQILAIGLDHFALEGRLMVMAILIHDFFNRNHATG